MKVPLSWLKSFVGITESLESLCDRLTFAGLEVENVEDINEDQVIELEITPNRPDCLSIIGIAREVSILSGLPLTIHKDNINDELEPNFDIKLNASKECFRYTARIIEDVQIKSSPLWIQTRLEAAGIRPINNIVDITNYVMLETGHPLHAFDASLIEDGEINIRFAKEGESFKSLSGIQSKLNNNMLVIADSKKPIALAGIIGGANSEINPKTKSIILEAACFNASNIRSTAKHLGIHTDSSYRFQRGVCAESVLMASDRAANMIIDIAGAASCSQPIDIYSNPMKRPRINFSWERISGLIGAEISSNEIEDVLKKLYIEIENIDAKTAIAIPPFFRQDLQREIDLVEEVARVYGMEKIPSNTPAVKVIPGNNENRSESIEILRTLLQGLGANEIINYTLVGHSLLDRLSLDHKEEREVLPHPISEDQSVLRTSLIPQLVESMGRNYSRQNQETCFYEIGRIFKSNKGVVSQFEHLSIGMMGPVGRTSLNKRSPISEEEQFIWGKGFIEELLLKLGFNEINFQLVEHNGFESNQGIKIQCNKKTIGILGLICRNTRDFWRINTPIVVAELGINALIQEIHTFPLAKEVPIYPSVNRDLALIVDESVSHDRILTLVNDLQADNLECVRLFDIYKGKEIEKGKKSVAYNFIYRSSSETLTDEKVNISHQKIMDLLSKELPAEIRI